MGEQHLNELMGTVWLVLAASAGLGVVTMAIVQLVKDLLPIRESWQKRWVETRVNERAREACVCAARALDDLIRLASANNPRALYSLPIEQLAGQANAAAQAVLDFPARHKDLLMVMAAGADSADVEILLSTPPPPPPPLRAEAASGGPEAAQQRTQEEERGKFADARNRVAHQVQRNLDALQIVMSVRWKFRLQLLSILVSVVCAFIVTVVLFPWPETPRGWMEAGLKVGLIGILGGFLSTVVRDLVAAIQGTRGRS